MRARQCRSTFLLRSRFLASLSATPQLFQLVGRHRFQLRSSAGLLFHCRESPAELCVRLTERKFGIDLQMPSQIYCCEEQIAEFLFHALVLGVGCELGAQLRGLLCELIEKALDVWPVKSNLRSA